LGLTLPASISQKVEGLQGKGKLIIATCTAIGAMTMAFLTFFSGGDGMDDLTASASAIDWNGPVGLLDPDYRHLATVGKLSAALNQNDYESEGVRDPMVAPSGALVVSRPATDGEKKAPAPTTLPNMWLSGIIWDPENPIAMIDGIDLRVGDTHKKARVVEIRIDSVVLSFASKRYVLTVE
jgi:hypothetical protein